MKAPISRSDHGLMMAAVAQRQSSRLWSERSWVQIPSVAPRIIVVALVLWLLIPGWSRAEVTVFAAVSLTEALESVARLYDETVTIAVGASSTLARQIEAGARPDIFISAHPLWMDRLETLGLIDGASRRSLLGNTLVIVTAAPSEIRPRRFTELNDWLRILGSRGRIAIGDPAHVPAGLYAREALLSLGIWRALTPYLAPADSVRGALNWVLRRETPLGIVYASDVSERIKVLGRFPADSHTAIEYPIAILSGRQENPEVRRCYRFFRETEARAVYQRYGFSVE